MRAYSPSARILRVSAAESSGNGATIAGLASAPSFGAWSRYLHRKVGPSVAGLWAASSIRTQDGGCLIASDQLAPGEFRLRRMVGDGTHWITLEGELDLASAADVEAELESAEQSGAERIVVDLESLTFIDSTGLALLVAAINRSEADACRLRIKPSESVGVLRVLETTGIADRLPYLD